MFHQDYLRLKALKEKLAAALDEKQKTQNQEISFRNLYVYPHWKAYGEKSRNDKKTEARHDLITRLLDYIELLAYITNEYHQRYYCDRTENGNYVLKQDSLNSITRLLMTEFSLYASTPLTLSEFQLINELIYEIALLQHDNVHLLLSSFSVQTESPGKKPRILNLALYVQCGKEPKIETISKGMPSIFDLHYSDTKHHRQFNYKKHNFPLKEYIASGDGNIIPSNCLLHVKTAGGAEYMQAVEICVVHAYAPAKNSLMSLICSDIQDNPTIYPMQADHVLSSASFVLQSDCIITEGVVQIDTQMNKATHMQNDKIFEFYKNKTKTDEQIIDLQGFKRDNYPAMTVTAFENKGISIDIPPFGSGCQIIVAEEQKLQGYKPEIQSLIENRNKFVKDYILEQRIERSKTSAGYNQVADQSLQTVESTSRLLNKLFNLCKKNSFEVFFNLDSAKVKTKAEKIVQDTMDACNELLKDPVYYMQHVDIILDHMKTKLAHAGDGESFGFLDEMLSQIEISKDEIKSVKFKS